jgi:hypothetical protein
VDEAGFAAQPPNRAAWMKRRQVHKRTQRPHITGALLSQGNRMMAKRQSVNGLWFFGFLMALVKRISKPLVVFLDNTFIHTAKKLKS